MRPYPPRARLVIQPGFDVQKRERPREIVGGWPTGRLPRRTREHKRIDVGPDRELSAL